MVYYASRASLEGCDLLRHLEQPPVDVPSKMLEWTMSGKANEINTPLDDIILNKDMNRFSTSNMKDAAGSLMNLIDTLFTKKQDQKNGDCLEKPTNDKQYNYPDEFIRAMEESSRSINRSGRSISAGNPVRRNKRRNT